MLINLICLCVVNGFFAIAGIFLNSGVIISLWKSPQLRRGNCHFMIFVLSCFDLLVIIVAHPTIILLSIPSFEETTVSQIGMILKEIYITLQLLEMCVLLSMSLDRYLAIVYPFVYQARITKGRIVKFMIFSQLIIIVVLLMHRISYMEKLTYIIIGPIIIVLILCMICYMNYKIFVIARNKRRATHDSTIEFNRNSTCVWVIACFLICTIPAIVFGAFKFGASNVIRNENFWTTFRLWSSTIATMNCTFMNCVILFWRNRFLRRNVN